MAKTIDDALFAFTNFVGYKGQAPTNATEYANLTPLGVTVCKTADNEEVKNDTVFTGTAPTWDEVLAKKTELETAETDAKATKTSAYKKLGMTDAEIAAILE